MSSGILLLSLFVEADSVSTARVSICRDFAGWDPKLVTAGSKN